MAEDDDSLEAEIVYPITCGDSKANLIWRKFVCPGINVKCVQVGVGPWCCSASAPGWEGPEFPVSTSSCVLCLGFGDSVSFF